MMFVCVIAGISTLYFNFISNIGFVIPSEMEALFYNTVYKICYIALLCLWFINNLFYLNPNYIKKKLKSIKPETTNPTKKQTNIISSIDSLNELNRINKQPDNTDSFSKPPVLVYFILIFILYLIFTVLTGPNPIT